MISLVQDRGKEILYAVRGKTYSVLKGSTNGRIVGISVMK